MESHDSARDELMDDVFLQDDLCPTIAEHATQCQSLFHKFMVVPGILPDPTIMDDQLARFSLWTSNMDVYGPLNVSLDYRLRFSPTAADIIHQLLDVICDTLSSLKPVDDRPLQKSSRKRQRISSHDDSGVPRRVDDNASDSDTDIDLAEENILKVTATIDGTLTRLFCLSNAVRKSAKANRARKIERYRDDEEANKAIVELRLYTECYICFRFPTAPDALRLALIEANALRLRRLFYQRSHRRRIELSIQSPQTKPVVQLPKVTAKTPAIRFAPNVVSKPATNRTSGPAPVPATNATTARQTAVAAYYGKATTKVPRAKSALVNNKLSFPPPPRKNECPYCGVIVEFKNTASSMMWQDHVIGDLEPFICIFSQCLNVTSPVTFETSRAWSSHMQTFHGHTWECRAPSHDLIVFDQEIQYQEHSIKEHGVPEAHAGTLSSAARRLAPNKVLECVFGDDFENLENGESSAVFLSEALQSHVAAHMKQIALLTLQKLPGDDDENAKNYESDQASDDDGPGFGVTRESMDSLLGDEDLEFQDDGAEAEVSSVGHGEDLDFRDDDGEAAVSGVGHGEDISASVPLGALDLANKDDLGMTELHHAVKAGNLHLVDSLINRGASLGSRDNDGRTALHLAAMEPKYGPFIMDFLLNASDKVIMNLGDEYGQTALHYAAESGSIECIELLVGHGVDIGTTDKFGFSPCLWAVVAWQTGATDKLLSMGADANLSSVDGRFPLAWAAGLGHSSIAKLLLDRGASVHASQTQNAQMMPLEEAAAIGDITTIQMLLRFGVDPNLRDRDGWSAIHWATEEGHLDIVSLLLDQGANVNAVSSYGTSPLHCASNGGHASIVGILLRHGADPLKSSCYGWTALHHAAVMGHSRVVQCLLEDYRIRSSAAQQDNDGWSVLHLAVHSRDLDTINLLLDSSVIAEPQSLFDESGFTPEDWLDFGPTSRSQKARATRELAFSKSRCCRAVTGLRRAVKTGTGNVPMIKLLLRLGDEVDGVDSGRRTALYYAVKRRMLPVIDLLLSLGADPNILPDGRRTWGEFISDADVLLRLNRAGYQNRDIDPEVEQKVRLAFAAQRRPSLLDESTSFVAEESISPIEEQPSSMLAIRSRSFPSVPASSPPGVPVNPPSISGLGSIRSPIPTQETNDRKRKAESKSWWKRVF